jgi:hypothetical protein
MGRRPRRTESREQLPHSWDEPLSVVRARGALGGLSWLAVVGGGWRWTEEEACRRKPDLGPAPPTEALKKTHGNKEPGKWRAGSCSSAKESLKAPVRVRECAQWQRVP